MCFVIALRIQRPQESRCLRLPLAVRCWTRSIYGCCRWATTQPCGPDLEYDDASLALRAAAGKPDSQFGPGEPPDWARIREIAESLFTRTRDLRVAMWWSRAKINLDRFAAFGALASEA